MYIGYLFMYHDVYAAYYSINLVPPAPEPKHIDFLGMIKKQNSQDFLKHGQRISKCHTRNIFKTQEIFL